METTYIVTIECRKRVTVKVPDGTPQEQVNELAVKEAVKDIVSRGTGYFDADNYTEVEPDEYDDIHL